MMEETERRREIQLAYNEEHGIIPKTVTKSRDEILMGTTLVDEEREESYAGTTIYEELEQKRLVADPVAKYLTEEQRADLINNLREEMMEASKNLEYERAAELRDSILQLEAASGAA